MKEQVRFADQAPGAALHQDSLETAILLVAAKGRQMVHVEVNVSGNIQVYEAVAIIVSPGRAGAESARGHTGFVGHVLKFAISQVAVERISAEPGDVDVGQTIVIEVSHGHAHAPALASQSRSVGDVGEFEIRVLMVERDHGIAALAIPVNARSVDRDDIELAVVIAVDEPGTAAHGFDDVFLFRSRNMRYRQPGFFCDVLKCGHRRFGADASCIGTEAFFGSSCLGRRE